jgi:hypothetical protein
LLLSSDALDFNHNANTTETLTARSNAASAGDLLCPASKRASLTAAEPPRGRETPMPS